MIKHFILRNGLTFSPLPKTKINPNGTEDVKQIATIDDPEGLILWEALKKNAASIETMSLVKKKYKVVNADMYVLYKAESPIKSEADIITVDNFYVLKGDYRL